jgi:hypothetical protein
MIDFKNEEKNIHNDTGAAYPAKIWNPNSERILKIPEAVIRNESLPWSAPFFTGFSWVHSEFGPTADRAATLHLENHEMGGIRIR